MESEIIKDQISDTIGESPEVVEESKEISRRAFIRKSAQVAAISLFGVLGFDAIADKVLEQIAETRAAGRLSDAAANALNIHKVSYSAYAGGLPEWPCNIILPNNCQIHDHVCYQTYGCNDTEVQCNKFKPGCTTQEQYGCTDRELTCVNENICNVNNCVPTAQGGKFECGNYNLPPNE